MGNTTFHASCTNHGKIPQGWGLPHTADCCYHFSHSPSLSVWTPFRFPQCSADYTSDSNINYSTSFPLCPPSLGQILVCAQLFPVPIASPELRGDGASLSSYPVMSHVCSIAKPRSEEGWALGRGVGKGFSVVVRKRAQGGVGLFVGIKRQER